MVSLGQEVLSPYSKPDADGEPLFRLPSTGTYINAERAAAACLPDTTEVMNSGYEAQFVRDVVAGKPSAAVSGEAADACVALAVAAGGVVPASAATSSPDVQAAKATLSVEVDGVQAVLRALKAHPTEAKVQQAGMNALFNVLLSSRPKIRSNSALTCFRSLTKSRQLASEDTTDR